MPEKNLFRNEAPKAIRSVNLTRYEFALEPCDPLAWLAAQEFREKFGYPDFDALFEKAYFSFQIRLKKPGRAVFEYVLNDRKLSPSETLFIDDSIQHIEGALSTGMQARYLDLSAGENITDLFSEHANALSSG